MAINMSDLRKQDGGAAKAALPHVPAGAPIDAKPLPKDNVVSKPVVKKLVMAAKPGMRYFHSVKPNLGFFMHGKRIAFTGNYLETADNAVAEYTLAHYGKYVMEITEAVKVEGLTFKS